MVKIKMTESNFPNVNGPTVITKKIGSKEYFFIVRTHQGKEEYLSIGMDRQPKWVTNFNFASTYPDAGAAQEAYDMMMKNYKESNFNFIRFEKNIPYNMRYKECRIEEDVLYWVTQDSFDKFDLTHFIDALEDTTITKAYVIVRDDSTYNFKRDLANGYGVMIDLTKDQYIIPGHNIKSSCITLDEAIVVKENLMIPGTNIMLEAGDKIRISGVSKKNEEWSSDQLTAWASKQDEVIFKEGDFTLIKRYGVGIKNTPYSTYSVLVSGQAEECVIDFYLESRFQNFNGELVEDTPKKITLKWGFSSHMVSSSLMIKKLTEAYKFADKVSKYFKIEFTNK